jgi:hypothetical protein
VTNDEDTRDANPAGSLPDLAPAPGGPAKEIGWLSPACPRSEAIGTVFLARWGTAFPQAVRQTGGLAAGGPGSILREDNSTGVA